MGFLKLLVYRCPAVGETHPRHFTAVAAYGRLPTITFVGSPSGPGPRWALGTQRPLWSVVTGGWGQCGSEVDLEATCNISLQIVQEAAYVTSVAA